MYGAGCRVQGSKFRVSGSPWSSLGFTVQGARRALVASTRMNLVEAYLRATSPMCLSTILHRTKSSWKKCTTTAFEVVT